MLLWSWHCLPIPQGVLLWSWQSAPLPHPQECCYCPDTILPGVFLQFWHCLSSQECFYSSDTVYPPRSVSTVLTLSVLPGVFLQFWHCLSSQECCYSSDTVYPPRSIAMVLTLSILPGVLLWFWHEELGHVQPADHGGALRWACPGLQPGLLGPEGEPPAWRQGRPWCLLHQVIQGHVLQTLLQAQADRAVSGQHTLQILWVVPLIILKINVLQILLWEPLSDSQENVWFCIGSYSHRFSFNFVFLTLSFPVN